MTLDELIQKAKNKELSGADISAAIVAMDRRDLALLIHVVAGLIYAADLEPDYIANRIQEWQNLKAKK
jgi:hypothetical protein